MHQVLGEAFCIENIIVVIQASKILIFFKADD